MCHYKCYVILKKGFLSSEIEFRKFGFTWPFYTIEQTKCVSTAGEIKKRILTKKRFGVLLQLA